MSFILRFIMQLPVTHVYVLIIESFIMCDWFINVCSTVELFCNWIYHIFTRNRFNVILNLDKKQTENRSISM